MESLVGDAVVGESSEQAKQSAWQNVSIQAKVCVDATGGSDASCLAARVSYLKAAW